ncbi:MAG: YIP1 family protein [Elusimicrobia bacterium]|nr:YIP1 family protein [Elusimicrobiota bacterium]
MNIDDGPARLPEPGVSGSGAQPQPPGPAAMLGQSITAMFRAGSLFDEIARAPAPEYWVMTANLFVFAAAAHGATNLLQSVGGSSFGMLPLRIAAGIALSVVVSFILASIVGLVARFAEGDGDYRRCYQIVSLSSGVAMTGIVINYVPVLWPVPIAWTAFIIGVGVQRLLRAKPAVAWTAFVALGAIALAGQWCAIRQVERIKTEARRANATLTEFERLRTELQKALPAALPDAPPYASSPSGQPVDASPAGSPGAPAGNSLWQRPDGSSPARNEFERWVLPPAQGLRQPDSAPDAGQRPESAAGEPAAALLQMLLPMLNNPQTLKNLPPEQARQVQQLAKSLEQAQRSIRTGEKMQAGDPMKMLQSLMQMQGQMMRSLPLPSPPTGEKGQAAPRRSKRPAAPAAPRKPAADGPAEAGSPKAEDPR